MKFYLHQTCQSGSAYSPAEINVNIFQSNCTIYTTYPLRCESSHVSEELAFIYSFLIILVHFILLKRGKFISIYAIALLLLYETIRDQVNCHCHYNLILVVWTLWNAIVKTHCYFPILFKLNCTSYLQVWLSGTLPNLVFTVKL